MSLLTINGVAVQVAKDGITSKRDLIGAGFARAANAGGRMNFQAAKWHPQVKCVASTQAIAVFLGAMLDALGDHWNFDADLYSDKGVGPDAVTAGASIDTTDHKYGAGSLKIAIGLSDDAAWSYPPIGEGWTVLVWRLEGGAWHHYIVTGTSPTATPNVYKDGVAQSPGMPTWMAINTTSGLIGFVGNASVVEIVDDFVLIPAFCDPSLVASLYAFHNTQAWPLYPTMLVGGDAMPGGATKTMLGPTSGFAAKTMTISGGYFAVELSFDLQEV